MSKKKITQIISIALLLVAVFLLIPYNNWKNNNPIIVFLSLVFGTLGSIISIFIPTVYIYSFIDTAWKKTKENDFELTVKAKKHGIGNSPQIQVFMKQEDSFEEIVVPTKHKENGNIIISANMTFNGKIIVK